MFPQVSWITFFFAVVQMKWLPKMLVKHQLDETPSSKLPFLISQWIYLHGHISHHSEELYFKGRWSSSGESDENSVPLKFPACPEFMFVLLGFRSGRESENSFFVIPNCCVFIHSLLSNIMTSQQPFELVFIFSWPQIFLIAIVQNSCITTSIIYLSVCFSICGGQEPCFIHSGVAGKAGIFIK